MKRNTFTQRRQEEAKIQKPFKQVPPSSDEKKMLPEIV